MFEKADSLRGILAVTNNIAALYADKLQDNKKALEYFYKLKNQSVKNNAIEFSVFAYINIAEILFKQLCYTESLSHLTNGLEKAKEASMERLIFYAYCHIVEIYIKLNDYKSAFHYFKLLNEELSNYPDQGQWLIHYYRVVSLLMLETDDIDKAMENIKKAIRIADSEDSIIKWNTGFVYEMIKLRKAKIEADISDSIEGVKFILSHYKNPEAILDKAYDYAIELIHTGYIDYAIEFLNDYKSIKYHHKNLKWKESYIRAITYEDKSLKKIEFLKKAIDAVLDVNNKKFYTNFISAKEIIMRIMAIMLTLASTIQLLIIFFNLYFVLYRKNIELSNFRNYFLLWTALLSHKLISALICYITLFI